MADNQAFGIFDDQSQAAAAQASITKSADEGDNRYLIFRLAKELYGTPLLGVREIVEYQKCKSVPNTLGHFIGVMNLRGQVVGVIDLRKRFKLTADTKKEMALVVFETPSGPLAALVDKVDSVSRIEPSKIENQPNIQTEIPLDFLIGVGRIEEDLINILDLKKVLSSEDLTAIDKFRTMAG